LEDLKRLKPVSRSWGGDRGVPIDRYYIEKFLEESSSEIKGRVLEIGDNKYTLRYSRGRVTQSEILHASTTNPKANYVADLSDAPQISSEIFDCVICTQTLHLIANIAAAIKTLHRILKPGGALIASMPGISQIYLGKNEDWKDYWRFTRYSVEWLFKCHFPARDIEIQPYGNVLAATSFLQGLSVEDLNLEDLKFNDPCYQMVIMVKAIKA